MSRRRTRMPLSGAVMLTGAVIAALVLATGACSVSPVDLTTVAPCPGETGPGAGGPAPCVWDSETRGIHPGDSPVRWYLYSDGGCPVATVQPADDVHCVMRADWSEIGE